MSIHADDEFSLKFAVECELDDVVPRDGLAGVVITRYRRGRRRRLAGAFGLLLACAGIGVPVGILSSGSGAASHDAASPAYGGSPDDGEAVVLRLGSFALKLPGRYRAGSVKSASCSSVVPAQRSAAVGEVATGEVATGEAALGEAALGEAAPVAAISSGACVVMMLAPASVSGELPRGARQVIAGHYRAWQLPVSLSSPAVAGLLIEGPSGDLLIGSDGLSQPALLDLVGAGLRG